MAYRGSSCVGACLLVLAAAAAAAAHRRFWELRNVVGGGGLWRGPTVLLEGRRADIYRSLFDEVACNFVIEVFMILTMFYWNDFLHGAFRSQSHGSTSLKQN
ncbi:hypothetical protein O6H91_Y546500 [Diphasiastrum complanatum]|nr:hypothetical protein O6H91_Y546500 [Diphasiastrum complanatum]